MCDPRSSPHQLPSLTLIIPKRAKASSKHNRPGMRAIRKASKECIIAHQYLSNRDALPIVIVQSDDDSVIEGPCDEDRIVALPKLAMDYTDDLG
jgi:hypothetical protein